MNTLIRSSCLILVSAIVSATACSKKSDPSPAPAASAPPAAPTPTTPAPSATEGAAKAAADLSATARTKAEDTAKALAAETNAALKKTEAAAADAERRVAEAASVPSAVAMPLAPASPPVVSGAGQAGIAGAANLAASQTSAATDALKAQAEQLAAQYSGQLATLKSNAVALKGLMDKNASMLPAGVAAKYQELNSLLPELTNLVDTLRNYQSADLTTLVPKLKTDFTRAQTLYTEIKSLMP